MTDREFEARLARLDPRRARLFVRPPDGAEVVPAETYLAPERLAATIAELHARVGGSGPRVAASQWSKNYAAALMSGPLTAMTRAGIGLSAAPERVSIILAGNKPRALLVPDLSAAVVYPPRAPAEAGLGRPVATPDDLYRAVLPDLLRHLHLMVESVHEVTRMSRKVLWGNIGSAVADLYDRLAEVGDCTAAVAADRHVLLDLPESPYWPGPNPLYQPVRYLDLSVFGFPSVRVRRTCCLRYQIVNKAPCTSCPLIDTEERARLLLV